MNDYTVIMHGYAEVDIEDAIDIDDARTKALLLASRMPWELENAEVIDCVVKP